MTNREINRAIAEASGWQICPNNRSFWQPPNKSAAPVYCSELPDYCADLNWMHEAEKILNSVQEMDYVEMLSAEIMSEAYDDATAARWKKSDLSSSDSTYRATANQRAKSFLKAIGRWQDSPQPSNPAAESQQASRSPSTSVGGGIL